MISPIDTKSINSQPRVMHHSETFVPKVGYEVMEDGSPWAPRANVLFADSSNPQLSKGTSGELRNRLRLGINFRIKRVYIFDTA